MSSSTELIWYSCGLAAVAMFPIAAMLVGRTRWSRWYAFAWPCVLGGVVAACCWLFWNHTWLRGFQLGHWMYYMHLLPVFLLVPLLGMAYPRRWLLPSIALVPVCTGLAIAAVYLTQTYPVVVQVQDTAGAPLSSRSVSGRLGPNIGQDCDGLGPTFSKLTDTQGKVSFRLRKDQRLHFEVTPNPTPYTGMDGWYATPQHQTLYIHWNRHDSRTIDVGLSNYGAGIADAAIFQWYNAKIKRGWRPLVVPIVEQPRDAPLFDMAGVWRRVWPEVEVQEISLYRLITLTPDDLRSPRAPAAPYVPTLHKQWANLLEATSRSVGIAEYWAASRFTEAEAERASRLLCRQLLGEVEIPEHQERIKALNQFIAQRANVIGVPP